MRLFDFVVPLCLVIAYAPLFAADYSAAGIFEIDKSDSEIRVLVYRGGLLGGFGHNHVISTSDIAGRIEIAEDPTASSVELTIPVESFGVDVAAIRVEEGKAFKKQVSEKDRRGTKENMLGPKLLNSANFPIITIRSKSWSGKPAELRVNSEITVRDQTEPLQFPASVSVDDDQIVVAGEFVVTHEQLGLKPFTAVFGAVRVRKEMEIRFRITAERVSH